jgi:hypothetical protein
MSGRYYKEGLEHSFNYKGALSLHLMKTCIEEDKYKERQKLLDSYVK